MSTRLYSSPWGKPDDQRDIGDGVITLSTPGHGGYYVPPAMLARMPAMLRSFKTWAGPGWYEEDCDWSIVALAFPHLFDGRLCWYAIRQGASDYMRERGIDIAAYTAPDLLGTSTGYQCKQKADAWAASPEGRAEIARHYPEERHAAAT